ncbi:MAG: winged helix-turn-helix transcriptional regulator [Gemmatimonadota bacterium]|nr:helix-turn-helix domain-containing protein [Gemmatimonadales bacterium]MDQ3138270.1 winged helix-turn-helix transcriptional regulator [Gemmatimonadota bacterium]
MGATLPIRSNTPAPLGHKGQRGAMLVELKRARRLTAKELAARLGVSLNAVRHHLKELEGEGYVEYEREHRGVGAPAFAYRLSSTGDALFPRRYEETLTALLDHMVERDGRAAAVALLETYFAGLTRRLQSEFAGASPAERLHALGRVLSEEGYMAEVTARASDGILTEHNCAIPAVAERFPEICAAEARFLADVLGAEVDRREHMLRGCSACEYHVRFKPAQENS